MIWMCVCWPVTYDLRCYVDQRSIQKEKQHLHLDKQIPVLSHPNHIQMYGSLDTTHSSHSRLEKSQGEATGAAQVLTFCRAWIAMADQDMVRSMVELSNLPRPGARC